MKYTISLLLFALVFNTGHASTKKSLHWSIKHSKWKNEHTKNYESFIQSIGEAQAAGVCDTTKNCLENKIANPLYYNIQPEGLNIASDCADLPFTLRAYFSWVNDLPFSYPSWPVKTISPAVTKIKEQIKEEEEKLEGMVFFKKAMQKLKIRSLNSKLKTAQKKDNKSDIRYYRYGNKISKRISVREGDNVNRVLSDLRNKVSTAVFRIHANKYDTGENYKDFYSVKISRDSVRPGTVVYDPAGHIAVVYKVTDDGRILMIDAHPDDSLTTITFGKKFSRSKIDVSAGLMNFRPIEHLNGTISAASNDNLEDFSIEQFVGTESNDPTASTTRAVYKIDGEEYRDYYTFVRQRLSIGMLTYNPIEELSFKLDDLCTDLHDRNDSVNSAIKSGLDKKDHPEKLPENIYGTSGEWESFSTPSRDARFKVSVGEASEMISNFNQMQIENDSKLTYTGNNLIAELKNLYIEKASSCIINFTGSDNTQLSYSLDDAITNLFKLSFDPYHSIELRWGIVPEDSKDIDPWYIAEKNLRRKVERDYSVSTNYGLRELKKRTFEIKDQSTEYNLRDLLDSLN
ncbi:MAG: hypothetical protein KAG61_13630 [Bacteriovoracaceae bacterium]|nr:hypothetical protein [Bacteriovoracaceae bacterium]